MQTHFLPLAAVLLAGLLSGQAAEPSSRSRPNFILVLADDVGLSRIRCYGGEPFATPCLDRLAAEGMRFERCYSMPLCGPSRAVLLTGKYPFRTGAINNSPASEIDAQSHPTLPAVLQAAGYATCAVGKLGQSAPPEDAGAPGRLGFDESFLWMGRGTPDRYWKPRYYRNGEVLQGREDEYGPDLTQAFLLDFLRRHREQPFFVYYSSVLSHGPFQRTPDSRDERNFVPDMVAYLDKQMGQLADALKELQLRESTYLLVTSDNGPMGAPLGTIRGSPMLGGKGDLTEGGVREPLIVSGPLGVAPGTVCDGLVDFTDFFPTLLDLAGLGMPGGLRLDGRSFAPWMRENRGPGRPWVYAQLGQDYFIADARYKLYRDGRLVDITDSPVSEQVPPEGDSGALAAGRRLREALAGLRGRLPEGAAGPAKAPLRAVDQPDLAADLRVLVKQGILGAPEPWSTLACAGQEADGARVAELLLSAAGKFGFAPDLDTALALLRAEGILSAAAYWKEHARPGRTCAGANLGRFINKLAQGLSERGPAGPGRGE